MNKQQFVKHLKIYYGFFYPGSTTIAAPASTRNTCGCGTFYCEFHLYVMNNIMNRLNMLAYKWIPKERGGPPAPLDPTKII